VNGGHGLSMAAESKMWNRRFLAGWRDSPQKDSRFGGLQILLTWILADKHYRTRLPAPSAKAAASRGEQPLPPARNRNAPPPAAAATGVPGLLAHNENCTPLRWQRDGESPHSKMNLPSAQQLT
jgi:hypothetical protein